MREFPVSISQAFISGQRLYLRACPASIGPAPKARTTQTTNNEQPTTDPHRFTLNRQVVAYWRRVIDDGSNCNGELAPAINLSRHLFQGLGKVVKREQGCWRRLYESRHPHKRTLGSCVRCTVQELLSGLAR